MCNIANNIGTYLKMKGFSVNYFAQHIGIDQANLSKMIKGKQRISDKTLKKIEQACPDLNMTWLLTGEGDMILPIQERQVKLPADQANVQQRNYNSPGATMFATNVHQTYNTEPTTKQTRPFGIKTATTNVRPLIPMSMYKQPNLDVYEKLVEKHKDGVELVPYFPGFSDYQLYMEVQDEAMLPDFKVGDRVALSAMSKNTYILNGNIYAIDTINHGLFIRILIDRENHYECQSTNNHARYVTFRVPKSDVLRIYRVMGLIRTCI